MRWQCCTAVSVDRWLNYGQTVCQIWSLEVTHFSDRFRLMFYFLLVAVFCLPKSPCHHVHHHPSHRKLDVHHRLYPDVLPFAVFKMFKITFQCLCSSSCLPRCSALRGALWGCVASSVEAWRCRTGAEYDDYGATDYHHDSHHDDIRVEGHGPDNAVKGPRIIIFGCT